MSLENWSYEKQQMKQLENLLSNFPPNIMQRVRDAERDIEQRERVSQLLGGGLPAVSEAQTLAGQAAESFRKTLSEKKKAEIIPGLPDGALAKAQKLAEEMREYSRNLGGETVSLATMELERVKREIYESVNQTDPFAEQREQFRERNRQFAEQINLIKENVEPLAVTVIVNVEVKPHERQAENAQEEN